MVGSKAKTLVLNFMGRREYQFGDVTKELIHLHRVVSQEITMRDWILLLKVSATHGYIRDKTLTNLCMKLVSKYSSTH